MKINKYLVTILFLSNAAWAMEDAQPTKVGLTSSGSGAAQGKRPTMEDTHIHINKKIGTSELLFAGVYDGHGGDKVATLLKNGCEEMPPLHERIFEKISLALDIETAITQAFFETDQALIDKSHKEEKWIDGSTAVISIINKNFLYIANVGDSEAILISECRDVYTAENMTCAHKASDSDEISRIRSLGGCVFNNRVFGTLAVSRAFGDIRFKKPIFDKNFVCVEPNIKKIQLEPHHKYVILASDGLWDKMKHSEVAYFVHERQNKNPEEIANALIQNALEIGSMDNISVIVIKLF